MHECGSAQALGGAALPGRRALKCQPLRYSQRRRKKKLKHFFAQHPRRCSAPRATPRRQLSATQRLRMRLCHWAGKGRKHLESRQCRDSSGWRRFAAFESSPEERSASGSLRAWLSERSEFQARRWREYRSGCHFSGRRRRRRSCVSRCCCYLNNGERLTERRWPTQFHLRSTAPSAESSNPASLPACCSALRLWLAFAALPALLRGCGRSLMTSLG